MSPRPDPRTLRTRRLGPDPAPPALARPQIRLHGDVDDEMFSLFRQALDRAEEGTDDPVALELTTFGGDADVARRMAGDLRLFRERTGRRLIFLGRTTVYSSGITVMAAFPPADRWLSRETTLLIHGRSLAKTLELCGPLALERARVQAILSEIDVGLRLERDDFEQLVEGTGVGLVEVLERAPANWYLQAPEALARGLISGVV